jgi:glycosyltransferase involved in cell wall biosynthesis
MIANRRSFYVYQFFGRKVDLLFLSLKVFAKNRIIIDVHDLYDISAPESSSLKDKINKKIQGLNGIIVHSDRVSNQLADIPNIRRVISVPHFHYSSIGKGGKTSNEIGDMIDDQKTNVLFFGHIRKSKGIKEFISHANEIQDSRMKSNFHFIVAGNDTHDLYAQNTFSDSVSHSTLLRKVSDDELDQLFRSVQSIILPYKVISQSGILEMAIKYRVPVLCSDLEFFTTYLSEYQSFGEIFTLGDQGSFELGLKKIGADSNAFYDQKDLDKYLNDDRFDNFKNDFKQLLET